MLKNHLKDQIISSVDFYLSDNQESVIDELLNILLSPEDSILIIEGFAGTGKTTIVSLFVNLLDKIKHKFVLLAPTGRASKILRNYSQKPAYTIHHKIYKPTSTGQFELDQGAFSDTLFIVDEASLISAHSRDSIFGSGDLLDDLITYVFSGSRSKLILLGDSSQLAPVGEAGSRALNVESFRHYPVKVAGVHLTQVVRQSEKSGIVENALSIRSGIENPQCPFLKTYQDVIRVSGDELIDELGRAYDKHGEENVVVITSSNKRTTQFALGIRNRVFYKDSELEVGDRLMIVKNNYFWTKEIKELPFLANGETAKVLKIRAYSEQYGLRFVDVTLLVEVLSGIELEARILLDSLLLDTASLSPLRQQEFAESIALDYQGYTERQLKKVLREDLFFNALQVKFAYSITCHKAQGGQWAAVFIDYTVFNKEYLSGNYLRWLYTAFTRGTKEVFLINFPEEIFHK